MAAPRPARTTGPSSTWRRPGTRKGAPAATPAGGTDPPFENGPLAVVDVEDGKVLAYCTGGLVLDVPPKSLPSLVDWTIKEAKLGAAKLSGPGKPADPLLVLTEAALEGYGLPVALSEEERLAGRIPEGHKVIKQLTRAQWQLTKRGFGRWARIDRPAQGSERACVQLCIPSWQALDTRHWGAAGQLPPAELARLLGTYASRVARPACAGPSTSRALGATGFGLQPRGEVGPDRLGYGWPSPGWGGQDCPLDQVCHRRREAVRDGGALLLPQVTADDAVLAHQPGHALAVDRVAEAAQFGMDSKRAVVPAVFGMDFADLLDQGVLLELPPRPRLGAGDPPVVARAGDLQHPAYPLDAEHLGMGGDEVPSGGLHFISRAKYAAARRRICPTQDLPFQLPFLLRLARPRVLRLQPGQLGLGVLRRAGRGRTAVGITHPGPQRLGVDVQISRDVLERPPAGRSRHNAIASDRNSALYFEGRATYIYTFQDQQDPLSGVSTPRGSPQSGPGPRSELGVYPAPLRESQHKHVNSYIIRLVT